MAIEQKERYVVELEDGRRLNVVAASFQEVLAMYGEENVEKISKLEFNQEIKHE